MKKDLPNNIEVGERIRKTRENLKMNRETFSEIIDISDVFLGQIERGERSLSIKTLCRIVVFTGVSTDYLLFGKDDTNATSQRINRILEKSSDNMKEYIYKILTASFSFFKSYEKDSKINKNKE